ncbi:hypothetical protein MOQ_009207 [Trypanosoma cruzi marinkellei]|uniref:Uncharacterized protein n=1 Tax=Trypanosoma cruzi marinkellei TaxID=85056 RepID=K2MN51_TRYCR|nr:hypothetical protein MOQ_009207 [Trypanosoma cruzi marinkellei]
MTCSSSGTSRPRATTSVAQRTRMLPSLKSFRMRSRLFCLIPPCKHRIKSGGARNAVFRSSESCSTSSLRFQKMRTCCLFEMTAFSYSFTMAWIRCEGSLRAYKCCVMSVFILCSRSTSKNTRSGFKKRAAKLPTVAFHVAVHIVVCRGRLNFRIVDMMNSNCGAKPSSNMRSASSRIRKPTCSKLTTSASTKSQRRPGVETRTSQPPHRRSWSICCSRPCPPKAPFTRTAFPASWEITFRVCCTSSRVGQRTNTLGLTTTGFSTVPRFLS